MGATIHRNWSTFNPLFIGSLTETAIAAVRAGRHFIGIELNEDYCLLARERIAAEQAQLKLDF